MSQSLTAFYPLVLPEVAKCPRIVVRKNIVLSAVEFCERTNVWRESQPGQSVGSNNGLYDMDNPDAHTVVWKIMSATINGDTVRLRSPEWCDEHYSGWRDGSSGPGFPVALTQLTHDTFNLVPAPSQTMTLVLDVAYKPAKAATRLPDILYQEYEEAIACGALARLQSMRNKAWTDGDQATKNSAIFTDYIQKANLRQSKGFGRAPMRVKAQFL